MLEWDSMKHRKAVEPPKETELSMETEACREPEDAA